MNPKVDAYLSRAKRWQQEMTELRNILASFPMEEDFKWGHPCYTIDGANVVLIHGFKEYCALLFFKGALLHDSKCILIRQTENVQSSRQIRFSGIQEIVKLEKALKGYITQAIEVEKAGLKVEMKKTKEFPMPEEFQKALSKNAKWKAAFEALTPGRQRAYLLHFSSAKQSQTRESRIEKAIPQILAGKGLTD